MFKINLGDKCYKVSFRHYNPIKFWKAVDDISDDSVEWKDTEFFERTWEKANKHRMVKVDENGREVGSAFGTVCTIVLYEDKQETPVSEGSTVLSYLDWDKYDKEFGRKVSLARALKAAGFSRDDRIVFWKAYFSRSERAYKQVQEAFHSQPG